MQLGRASAFGVAALVFLGRSGPGHWATAEEIACQTCAPIEYLRKILQRLVRSGILASGRGRRGGFRLVRAPSQITLLELFESIHGPIGPTAVFGDDMEDTPQPTAILGVRTYQHIICDSLRTTLASKSLAELLEEYSPRSVAADGAARPGHALPASVRTPTLPDKRGRKPTLPATD